MIKKYFALCLILTSCGDRSYEDCVLNHLESNASLAKVVAVKESCRIKFPIMVNVEQADGSFKQIEASNFFGPIDQIKIEDDPAFFKKIDFHIVGQNSIEATNRSNSSIKSLTIGETSGSGYCPNDLNKYKRFITCDFYYADEKLAESTRLY